MVASAMCVSIGVSLVVIARLARVVGVGDPREFIKGSAPAEHGEAKECYNQFHDHSLLLQPQPRSRGEDPLGINNLLIGIFWETWE